MGRLGTGIGWRPEIAEAVERMPGIDWVEVVAENVCPGHLPESLGRLRERGVTVVPHGVSLGLGGAQRPDADRLTALAERAQALGSPLVTEHIAFVRAGGALTASPLLEAGHLLPVPRTRDALDVLCENVRIAQDALPVPLAVENIAALFSWPDEELTEGQFLYELAERTGVRLLIDVANLHTNHVNRGEDPAEALAGLPLEAVAYVHVAGGVERDGVWHDSHAHPVPDAVLGILADLAARAAPPGVLLERDENFPNRPSWSGSWRRSGRWWRAADGGRWRRGPARRCARTRATPRAPVSGSGSRRPPCCPRWWPGRPCPRGSTGYGWGCRRGRSRRSGRTWWRRWRPSCRYCWGRRTGRRSWSTRGHGRCVGGIGGTRWTSPGSCWTESGRTSRGGSCGSGGWTAPARRRGDGWRGRRGGCCWDASEAHRPYTPEAPRPHRLKHPARMA